jgi:bacterial/archaeal transporter family-2 protein
MNRSGGRAVPKTFVLVVAVVAGAMVGVQGRINGELAVRMNSALEAAFASFVVGLAIVGFAALFHRPGFGRLRRAQVQPWWFLSGLGGAFLVSSSARGVPEIGVALVSVCLVAGTTAGALVTDQVGLGPSGRQPVTTGRLAGVGLVIVAVVIGAVGQGTGALRPLLYLVLFAAGAASAVQQAANGQLRVAASDVVVASFVSFVGGTTALLIVTAAAGELSAHSWPSAPWLYLGGPLGVFYVLVGAVAVRIVGVLRFVLAAVAGQLIAAVVLDAVWPEPGTSLRAATVVGAAVTVAGVWLSGRGGARLHLGKGSQRSERQGRADG